jgi:hypothetical protein
MTCQPSGGPGGRRSRWPPVLAADLAVVLAFAFIGRVVHGEGSLVAGTIGTAAPFVLGLLAGWLRAPCAGLGAASRARTVRFGWWLVAWTLGGGLLLRWVAGDGSAAAFVAVASGVVTVGLVGRRWLVQVWQSRPARTLVRT